MRKYGTEFFIFKHPTVTRMYNILYGKELVKMGSQNSSGNSSSDTALKKKKAPKVVKSRYMQYEKPKTVKKPNAETSMLCPPIKPPDRGGSNTPTRKSLMPQRVKAPSVNSTVADGSIFWKDDLQSTLLDGHKIARPELDFSVINDKTLQKLTPKSSSTSEPRKPKKETTPISCAPGDLIDKLESQTLLFTYLTTKMKKNIKCLEEKAERSLLLANEEKNRLQEKVYQLKRSLLLARREVQLGDVLEKQAEGLVPSSSSIQQFKEKYISFATAVDCTRHQLPINNIHVVGTQQRYLDSIQKHLNSTKTLLEEAIPHTDDRSIDLLATIQSLEDIALKTDAELSRSFHQILDLSSKVNKEMSLQSQKSVEEHCEADILKQWYFDQAID
ncbi:HAUS augmin-like complex subunit 8 [Gastrophryne carolinensis]